jgi:hypothetical protein
MTTEDYLQSIVTRFRAILDTHGKHMGLFDEHAVQLEGWLKGELLPLFDSEKTDGRLVQFNTEVSCGYGRVDYHLIVPDDPIAVEVWLELKHFQIGRQGEYRWIASNYFTDKSIGIYRDVEKLTKIEQGDKYILVLATKNPEYEKNGDWLQGVDKFNRKFTPLRIGSLTNPSDFPQSYFLGLLEVVRK